MKNDLEKVQVMEDHNRGAIIEQKIKETWDCDEDYKAGSNQWKEVITPKWNWEKYDYRVKKTPLKVVLEPREDETFIVTFESTSARENFLKDMRKVSFIEDAE